MNQHWFGVSPENLTFQQQTQEVPLVSLSCIYVHSILKPDQTSLSISLLDAAWLDSENPVYWTVLRSSVGRKWHKMEIG